MQPWLGPQNQPFQLGSSILIFLDAPHHAAVLQRHPLQQLVVNIVADADGEEAELVADGFLGVAEDLGGLGLPHCGPPICQEDDQGDASGIDVILSNVIIQQLRTRLESTINIST